jgi:hypothetical protein
MPTLTISLGDGTVTDVELTDYEVETLFECLKRTFGADLNVWKAVFVFWLSEFARWWSNTGPSMQKMIVEWLAKIIAAALSLRWVIC